PAVRGARAACSSAPCRARARPAGPGLALRRGASPPYKRLTPRWTRVCGAWGGSYLAAGGGWALGAELGAGLSLPPPSRASKSTVEDGGGAFSLASWPVVVKPITRP